MQPTIEELLKRIEKLEQDNSNLLNMYGEFYANRFPGKTVYKNAHAYEPTTLIGFYGKDPIKQQTATDLPTALAALKAYGLLAP